MLRKAEMERSDPQDARRPSPQKKQEDALKSQSTPCCWWAAVEGTPNRAAECFFSGSGADGSGWRRMEAVAVAAGREVIDFCHRLSSPPTTTQ